MEVPAPVPRLTALFVESMLNKVVNPPALCTEKAEVEFACVVTTTPSEPPPSAPNVRGPPLVVKDDAPSPVILMAPPLTLILASPEFKVMPLPPLMVVGPTSFIFPIVTVCAFVAPRSSSEDEVPLLRSVIVTSSMNCVPLLEPPVPLKRKTAWVAPAGAIPLADICVQAAADVVVVGKERKCELKLPTFHISAPAIWVVVEAART